MSMVRLNKAQKCTLKYRERKGVLFCAQKRDSILLVFARFLMDDAFIEGVFEPYFTLVFLAFSSLAQIVR